MSQTTADNSVTTNASAPDSVEERKFSRKIESLAASPRHRGAFFTEDATTKDLALVTAKYRTSRFIGSWTRKAT